MNRRDFHTPLGVVPVWSDTTHFDAGRQLLVVIRGAFPKHDHLFPLVDRMPHLDVAFLHLPGMNAPRLSETSIGAFAAAFEGALPQAFPGRQINILGISVGGVAAMAIRRLALRSIIAVDTPLSTEGLWPLKSKVATLTERPDLLDWSWSILGVAPGRMETRDYRYVLDGMTTPTRVLVGDRPIGDERPLDQLPSLVTEADRALYRAHPRVGITNVKGAGHNIPLEAYPALQSTIHRWLGGPETAPSGD